MLDLCRTERNGIQQNLKGSKISKSSTKFVFLDQSQKQDGHPGLWLADIFLTSPLKPLNGIQQNLTGSKISTSSDEILLHKEGIVIINYINVRSSLHGINIHWFLWVLCPILTLTKLWTYSIRNTVLCTFHAHALRLSLNFNCAFFSST